MNSQQLEDRYGVSAKGNFYVKDTIPTTHHYCITPRHVAIASDRHGGRLGETAIYDAESHGAHCGVVGCKLTFRQHEFALLVACKLPFKDATGKSNEELHAYLLKCKPMCEADKYVGFAFLKEHT